MNKLIVGRMAKSFIKRLDDAKLHMYDVFKYYEGKSYININENDIQLNIDRVELSNIVDQSNEKHVNFINDMVKDMMKANANINDFYFNVIYLYVKTDEELITLTYDLQKIYSVVTNFFKEKSNDIKDKVAKIFFENNVDLAKRVRKYIKHIVGITPCVEILQDEYDSSFYGYTAHPEEKDYKYYGMESSWVFDMDTMDALMDSIYSHFKHKGLNPKELFFNEHDKPIIGESTASAQTKLSEDHLITFADNLNDEDFAKLKHIILGDEFTNLCK